jgi:hypothetical protein
MKHKLLISFFVLNELSAVALAATKGEGQAVTQTIYGAIGLAVFGFIVWAFVRVGLFHGLRFRHWVFMLTCILVVGAIAFNAGVQR